MPATATAVARRRAAVIADPRSTASVKARFLLPSQCPAPLTTAVRGLERQAPPRDGPLARTRSCRRRSPSHVVACGVAPAAARRLRGQVAAVVDGASVLESTSAAPATDVLGAGRRNRRRWERRHVDRAAVPPRCGRRKRPVRGAVVSAVRQYDVFVAAALRGALPPGGRREVTLRAPRPSCFPPTRPADRDVPTESHGLARPPFLGWPPFGGHRAPFNGAENLWPGSVLPLRRA